MSKEERKRLEQYCYDGSRHFSIREASTKETSLCSDKAEALAQMEKNNAKMNELQAKLYAAKRGCDLPVPGDGCSRQGRNNSFRADLSLASRRS